ncbi:hypothetical protein KIN20_015606 [Parelaphostrongylus tenuis]|uniref:Uncharacterized protein n=1 Tax=Parelaphostrongylus tenuis TaxID=148309 RepID=A0AAD5MF70_PARTN|nr:hypothetical protein KIN20_015606 [Parelaphostrongylus tenuis]
MPIFILSLICKNTFTLRLTGQLRAQGLNVFSSPSERSNQESAWILLKRKNSAEIVYLRPVRPQHGFLLSMWVLLAMISSFDSKSFRSPYQSRHHLTLLYLFKEHDISTISGSPHCKGIAWIDRTRKAKCLTASTPVFREGSPEVRPTAGETAEETTSSTSIDSKCVVRRSVQIVCTDAHE